MNTERELQSDRVGLLVQALSWILPILVALVVFVGSSKAYIFNLVTDDGLYYPVIARSIADGAGSSYDGMTKTNGYHPLWCWVQVPLAFFFSSFDAEHYLWVHKAFIVSVVLLTLFVWQSIVRRITRSLVASYVFVSLLGGYWWSIYTLYSGMETPLVILLIGCDLLLMQRLSDRLCRGPESAENPHPGMHESHKEEHRRTFAGNAGIDFVVLGISLGATFLSRLDTVFLLLALTLYVVIRFRRFGQGLLLFLTSLVIIPTPYLLWNVTTFGSFVPISGLKKTLGSPDLSAQLHAQTSFWLDKFHKLIGFVNVPLLLLFSIGLIACCYVARNEIRRNAIRLGPLWMLPIGAVVHYCYVSFFMTEGWVYWYQYAEYLSGFLITALIISSWSDWIRANSRMLGLSYVPVLGLVLFLSGILFLYVPKKIPNRGSVESYRAAIWAKNRFSMEPAPRFGMIDSGIFRYVSGFKTLALNGLAGDREVLMLVEQENYRGAIERFGIDYICNFFPSDRLKTIPTHYVIYQSEEYDHATSEFTTAPGRIAIVTASFWTER